MPGHLHRPDDKASRTRYSRSAGPYQVSYGADVTPPRFRRLRLTIDQFATIALDDERAVGLAG